MKKSHKEKIESLINNNKIFVFMKGEKGEPLCGFSAMVDRLLQDYEVEYEVFNVLSDQDIRQAIKDYTKWPTIPQIFINGKFIGGSDILNELNENGELEKILKE